jgi:hypothetical protein
MMAITTNNSIRVNPRFRVPRFSIEFRIALYSLWLISNLNLKANGNQPVARVLTQPTNPTMRQNGNHNQLSIIGQQSCGMLHPIEDVNLGIVNRQNNSATDALLLDARPLH